MYVGTRIFAFFSFDYCPLSIVAFFSFIFAKFQRVIHPYCRSERDIASKHTAQNMSISPAQVALGITKPLAGELTYVLTCF